MFTKLGSGIWSTLKETASDWTDDNAARLAAALAYSTLLSIAPLIVLAVAIAGLAFGEDAARGQIASEMGGVVGPQAAEAIQSIASNARTPGAGILSSILGIVVLLFGASGVGAEFTQVYARRHGSNIRPSKGAVAAPNGAPGASRDAAARA